MAADRHIEEMQGDATDFDLCGFRPSDTPCWCGWDDEQDQEDE